MAEFIKGMKLAESFFEEAARPLLASRYPGLSYSAGLLGFGSDVLGYDDFTSCDHMWGPRFYLFLAPEDIGKREAIMDLFSRKLPPVYRGFSVNFSEPDPEDHGVRHAEQADGDRISPLIYIYTEAEYLNEYLGCGDLSALRETDWLSFSEHKLLALTAGKFFQDDLKMADRLSNLNFYPESVRLYLIASNWSLAAEEQAFVRRCADVGDETGSMLACARIAERLMRLAFLYCRRYAPYSKWFGTAFARLPIDPEIKERIRLSLAAPDIETREEHLVNAQFLMAKFHNELGITEPVPVSIQNYFERKILVIWADRMAAAVKQKLQGTVFEEMPLIGSLSEVANFTALTEQSQLRRNIADFYDSLAQKRQR